MDVVLLLVGLGVGTLIGVLWSRSRVAERIADLEAARRSALDRIRYTEEAGERLAERFRALSSEALARNNTQFLELADTRFRSTELPIRQTLERLDDRLREIEQARSASQAALAQQIELVRTTSEQLRKETSALVTALRKPEVRGRWGEMQLKRAVEVAGLVERCDFETQAHLPGVDGALRPDMVVRLAGGKSVIVDAKVPLSAFLEAAEATDELVRTERLAAHARQLRTHVDLLAGKSYWQRLPSSPEFVVLFVPGEAFLAQALDSDATLLEYSAARKVVLATPTTLIALLRTVAYAWTQHSLADSAQAVFELGRELHERLATLSGHVDELGRALTRGVSAYNRTVGSLESRVLVSARRLRELGVVENELRAPGQVEEGVRAVGAVELLEPARDEVEERKVDPGYPSTRIWS